MRHPIKIAATLTLSAAILAVGCHISRASAAEPAKQESVVLAGGCFWGMEAVFEHVKGVDDVVSGYAGGKQETASYKQVGSGATGHAESVKITYNPDTVTLDKLLDVYFTVAHNPTELNYQGPDHGTQYRSAIFYATPAQEQEAKDKIAALEKAHTYSDPVVTVLEPLEGFYPAEDYHQNFAARHPAHPYIMLYDHKKVAHLQEQFPTLYKE